ncbi:MAG: glycosidase related protein [Gemmatimonadetes bacterium]|nr:glycosidase related protein [Gemmatimonadota bacterium]
MIRPSRPDLEVVGVFNPAATRQGDDIVLLLRVAEAPHKTSESEVIAPVFNASTKQLDFRHWDVGAAGLDVSDPRVIVFEGKSWLTSISHLRVARSRDGIHFDVESAPALSPDTELESFGTEDPRITLIDGTYWINYTAVSPLGIATALASTRDFRTFERHGIIFPPNNRDVTIFPERIGRKFVALHRPMPEGIGEPAMWSATSSDMMAWGDHKFVATGRSDSWDDAKIGGGAVPFRVKDGWLAVYHGVSKSPMQYSLGALLLDAGDPSVVVARSREPILAPEMPYEREGFFGGVVFTCGLITDGDVVRIYYGAADGVTAVADLSLAEILGGLE